MSDPIVAEAYARQRGGRMFLHALEITHSGLAAPIRVISETDADVSLPPAALQAPVLFQALPFTVVPPGQTAKEGPDDGRITIDFVSGLLRDAIDDLASTGEAAELIYREYDIPFVAGAPAFASVTGPSQIFAGLIVREISLSPTSASATVTFRDLSNRNVPGLTFSRDLYPALHGAS